MRLGQGGCGYAGRAQLGWPGYGGTGLRRLGPVRHHWAEARQDSVQSDRAGWSEAGLVGGDWLRWAGMIWKGLN